MNGPRHHLTVARARSGANPQIAGKTDFYPEIAIVTSLSRDNLWRGLRTLRSCPGPRRHHLDGMRILVTGASGFVGSQLIPRLLSDGHLVRALARDPAGVEVAGAESMSDSLLAVNARPRVHARGHSNRMDVLTGDVLSGQGLARALRGVEVAYYLIHSMERSPAARRHHGWAAHRIPRARAHRREELRRRGIPRRCIADRVPRRTHRKLDYRARCRATLAPSVKPRGGRAHSARRRSRHRRPARVDRHRRAVALVSFPRTACRAHARADTARLALHRTRPIDARDVTDMLAAAATVTSVAGHSLDVGGPDMLSYGAMIRRIAELMMLARPARRPAA